jgi:5-methyltetrahydrofolate--homocysteine methyltransferase
VASNLLSPGLNEAFARDVRTEYRQIREQRAGRGPAERQVPLAAARANRLTLDWAAAAPPAPCTLGVQVLDDYPLAELVDRIDWTPFFQTWELAGHYPAILEDPKVGSAARSLFYDARALLDRILRDRLLRARGVFGLFPAAAVGDDIEVYGIGDQRKPIATIHTLRQQMAKPPGRPNLALADYVAPRESGALDHVGAFAVTAGVGVDELVAEFEAAHDDYSAILVKALADRLAEAFAERLHERVRREFWGYARSEKLDNTDLIREAYQGIRPAPGYPACPDHTEKGALFELLDVERRVGIALTESFAMTPTAAVSGWYFWHPEARYFGVGKISRDQVEDYAQRKGMTVKEAERWLAPNLSYER